LPCVFSSQTPSPPPTSTLFPYTTLFRSHLRSARGGVPGAPAPAVHGLQSARAAAVARQVALQAAAGVSPHRHPAVRRETPAAARSEEHTSELQSLRHLVCRLLLEKKKKN